MTLELNFINERMIIDFARAIAAADEKLTIDKALPIVATPAVLIDFSKEDESDLKNIMRSIHQFLRRNKRFINLSKEAITEGLREEWLPNLEDEEKALMLSDYKIFEGIDEDGYIKVNHRLCSIFSAQTKPDRHKYGTMPYEPKKSSRRSVKKPKALLTVVEPDPLLAEKIAPYVKWYKENYERISFLEGYKWTATQTFQDVFDIDADDFYQNLKDALKDETNLLSGNFNFSKNVLLKNAKHSTEEVRFALHHLFDESVILSERVPKFIESFNEIHFANQQKGLFRQNEKPNQNDHSVSVLLAFRYPSTHFIYKYSMWYDAAAEMKLDYPRLSNYTHTLHAYEQICNQIRKVLLSDTELMALHDAKFGNDLSNYNLLTQDFLYAVYSHFQGFNKPPRH